MTEFEKEVARAFQPTDADLDAACGEPARFGSFVTDVGRDNLRVMLASAFIHAAPRVAAALRAAYDEGHGQGRADGDANAHDDEAVGPDNDDGVKAGLKVLRGDVASPQEPE